MINRATIDRLTDRLNASDAMGCPFCEWVLIPAVVEVHLVHLSTEHAEWVASRGMDPRTLVDLATAAFAERFAESGKGVASGNEFASEFGRYLEKLLPAEVYGPFLAGVRAKTLSMLAGYGPLFDPSYVRKENR